jgi:adenine-specific DNA-methyltransferase
VPPRKKAPAGPKPVEATIHPDKRTNIPTADAQDFVTPEVEQPRTLRWERDPSLDPQLVWRGKDETDDHDLEVDAPPIYIQEKIDPRVLVENLRKTAKAGEPEPEATLFDTFDGLDDLQVVEFYEHDANWSNRMILGDSLQVMASLNERESLRGKVQTIYLDPPYGIKFGSNWQMSARKRDVKDGKVDDASRQVEQIKAFRDTWELGIHSYLNYLRDRLVVARDLLTESGSCFVQIGDENVHLVRSLMDEVFGAENFVSLVTYRTTTGASGDLLGGTTDHIAWYAADRDRVKYRQIYRAKSAGGEGMSGYSQCRLPDGTTRRLTPRERVGDEPIPAGARVFALDNLTSSRPARESDVRSFNFEGRTFGPGSGTFKSNATGLGQLEKAGRLGVAGNTLRYVRFAEDFSVFPITNSWDDTTIAGFAADKVYVVQTNTKVIERCLLMTTDPGDLVLDPTCGSGTTAFVAEQWGRRWITIDSSRVALALARQRLMGGRFPYYLKADSPEGRLKEGQLTGTPLPDAATSGDIRQGFVYERVPHVTLKSIANNPDIVEGMSRADIDAAISRHADVELLYDKPYVDKGKVRVTGPFTVESLSPHRSLAFAGGPDGDLAPETKAEQAAAADPSSGTFEQMILENLAKAGIQNGRKQERLQFEAVEPYAGAYIQSVALRRGADLEPAADGEAPARVGIAVGPQYGTVDGKFIKFAAREAIAAKDIDLLCVLGFAFDPNALGATEDFVATDEGFANVAAERKLGKVPVLLVRMNADLVMGDELKKTGAGNLFTVFGEPDIAISEQPDGKVVVTLHGVDVYDPTTGEVRSRDTDHIALWMIDSDYNEESFFVRHCYFTGGQDPYKKLKTELKAEIDPDAWATLYRTESVPFDKPTTGKIAVKVINDYGDEVLQVFPVD